MLRVHLLQEVAAVVEALLDGLAYFQLVYETHVLLDFCHLAFLEGLDYSDLGLAMQIQLAFVV